MKKLLTFSFYDFGNSVFPMIIITTLTSSYFVNHVIENQQTASKITKFSAEKKFSRPQRAIAWTSSSP